MTNISIMPVHQRAFVFLLLIIITGVSCSKNDYVRKLPPVVDGLPDLNKKLVGNNAFRLFNMAIKKAKLDLELNPDKVFTILALTDASMQAGGYTETALNNMEPAELKNLFGYHILYGAFPKGQFSASAGYTSVQTLRNDVSFSEERGFKVYKQYLQCMERNAIMYLNGAEAGAIQEIDTASNGFIYTVDRLAAAPVRSLYQEIKSRPELFFYAEALRIIDSMYQVAKVSSFPRRLDSAFMNSVGSDFQVLMNLFSNNQNVLSLPTVFAPVNDAFKQAGFNSVADIRTFCYRTTIAQIKLRRFVNMDSVLKAHIVIAPRDRFYNFLFAADIQGEPNMNNGTHNISYFSAITNNQFPAGNAINNRHSQITVNNGEIFIRPTTNPGLTPAKVLENGKDILTMNGIIHEVDRLFYPIIGN